MAFRTIPMAVYANQGTKQITLKIGNGPGEPPNVYKVDGGGEVEGPLNYREAFKRGGFEFVRAVAADEERTSPAPDADLAAKVASQAATIEAMQKQLAALLAAQGGGADAKAAAKEKGAGGATIPAGTPKGDGK